ncbi:sugar phosphate isomerase/epimerase [Sinorhizobium fredii]
MTIKLAMHTWPYASNPTWLPAYTLEETIKRIKKIGYDAIEIGAAQPACLSADSERAKAQGPWQDAQGL